MVSELFISPQKTQRSCMKGVGRMERCMEKGFSSGETIQNTKDPMLRVERKGMENLSILLERYTRVSGRKENKMGLEFHMKKLGSK